MIAGVAVPCGAASAGAQLAGDRGGQGPREYGQSRGRRSQGCLAGRIDPRRLTAAFTVLIVAVAGYTLTRSLPGLL
ncbi:MAG: hypothetical protein ACLQK8_28290 [Streptosporangiaceae bacterium]|jgi:hypothetical protein